MIVSVFLTSKQVKKAAVEYASGQFESTLSCALSALPDLVEFHQGADGCVRLEFDDEMLVKKYNEDE